VADASVPITAGVGTPIRVLTALGAGSAGQQVVSLADSAGNLLGTTAAPLPTRDLLDTNRTAVVLSATAVASATTAALFTLNIWQAGAVTSATSYTVPAGKTFRVQGIQFGARFATPSTTVTFASARFDMRAISTGALAATSALVYGDTKMAAANAPTPNSDLAIPDGLEFPAGYVIGVSHADSAATLLLDVLIVGYTY